MGLKTTSTAYAPSNIALIKYMGKKDPTANIPHNASVSMTLDSLCTWMELDRDAAATDEVVWTAEPPRRAPQVRGEVPILSEAGIAKLRRQLERVREAALDLFPEFGLKPVVDLDRLGRIEVRSINTFPPASGIASSASSFAALTLAGAQLFAADPAQFKAVWESETDFRRAWARVARRGSGSACRSFEGPWVLWDDESAAAIESRMPKMAHFVVLISSQPKKVSSTDAHSMVQTSPLWEGRIDRVSMRTENLLAALGEGDLRTAARIAWTEAWEMHSLFHTAAEPFTYWEPGTLYALKTLAPSISEEAPPIVTLDAGPNVHVIVPAEARLQWKERLRSWFGDHVILEDQEGRGGMPL